jgi:hypothetical protein
LLGRDGLRCDTSKEMSPNVAAWQRRFWQRQLGRDYLRCDSLAEMASDVTA